MMTIQQYFLLAFFAGAIVFIIYKSWQIDNFRRQLSKKRQFEDEVDFELISTMIERERSRISAELHDELGTLLSVIHLDLELVSGGAFHPLVQGSSPWGAPPRSRGAAFEPVGALRSRHLPRDRRSSKLRPVSVRSGS